MKRYLMLFTIAIIFLVLYYAKATDASGIPCEDNLSDPGIPAIKTDYTEGLDNLQGPSDHFDYNTTDAIEVLPMISNDDILSFAEQLGKQPPEISAIKKELKTRQA